VPVGKAVATGVKAARGAKPLLGKNPIPGGTRTNTELAGNLSTTKSVFRNQTRGQDITQSTMPNGGVRRTATDMARRFASTQTALQGWISRVAGHCQMGRPSTFLLGPNMSDQSPNAGDQAVVGRLPDMQMARSLLEVPWTAVEVPNGQLAHRSRSYWGTWSVSSVLVRAQSRQEVLIFAESYEVGGQELFGLRFKAASDVWVAEHLATARPPFSPISRWPHDLEWSEEFTHVGPTGGEIGLNPAVATDDGMFIPVRWVRFSNESSGLLFFADERIPMNVGIGHANLSSMYQQGLEEKSAVPL